MMNPDAVARAAEAGPRPPPSPSTGPLPKAGGGGLDTMVQSLQGVGEFLQAQGPKGQKAMGAFQSLLQELAQLSQNDGVGEEPGAPEQADPSTPGRIHESMRQGVQVL